MRYSLNVTVNHKDGTETDYTEGLLNSKAMLMVLLKDYLEAPEASSFIFTVTKED